MPKQSALKRKLKITINVIVKDKAWRALVPDLFTLRHWAKETIQPYAKRWAGKTTEITIVLANDSFMRPLNRDYRGKDKATNVLSFPMLELGERNAPLEIAGEHAMLGDIVLARETIMREAEEQRKPFTHHLAHLVAHGCFHLLGYDHERRNDATIMETLETDLLARWGIPDPYVARDTARP